MSVNHLRSACLSFSFLVAACSAAPQTAPAGAAQALPDSGSAPEARPDTGSAPPVAGSNGVSAPQAQSGGPAADSGMPASAGRPSAPPDAGIADASAPDASALDAGAPDASTPDTASPTCNRTGAATADTPTIYVIGDSTASIYESDLYPRTGWAQVMQDYFTPACAKVQDKALSGRSSKSFYDEGAWTPIRDALHRGDFVLIQFGHNDEKQDDAARYTEPSSSYPMYLSKYIDDAQSKGATPILLTSIERNKWSHGHLSATHGDYPEAVRQLAQKRQLALVDMTMLTHAYFEHLGQSATTALFLNLMPGQFPNYPNGNSDDTHLQEKGAHVVCEIALADLARQHVAPANLLERVPAP